MSLIRDLSTWYDVPAPLPTEEALRQAFQGYKQAWSSGYVVLMDKYPGMDYQSISEWVTENKTGKARVHAHSTIAIVFFEAYEDALAFYMTFAK